MTKRKELKNKLKQMAAELRSTRRDFRDEQSKCSKNMGDPRKEWTLSCNLAKLKRDYRHYHIAYSLLRGKSYERIECPRKENKPDMAYVERIRAEYTEVQSDVPADEIRPQP